MRYGESKHVSPWHSAPVLGTLVQKTLASTDSNPKQRNVPCHHGKGLTPEAAGFRYPATLSADKQTITYAQPKHARGVVKSGNAVYDTGIQAANPSIRLSGVSL